MIEPKVGKRVFHFFAMHAVLNEDTKRNVVEITAINKEGRIQIRDAYHTLATWFDPKDFFETHKDAAMCAKQKKLAGISTLQRKIDKIRVTVSKLDAIIERGSTTESY